MGTISKRLSIEGLWYARAVAETGSFSAAARREAGALACPR